MRYLFWTKTISDKITMFCLVYFFRYHTYNLITIKGTDTVKDLKEKVLDYINQSIEEKENKISEEKIVVFHSQKDRSGELEETRCYNELDRDVMTVFECDIRPSDIISFIRYHSETNNKSHVGTESHNVDIKINEELGQFRKICGVYVRESVHSLRLKIQHQLNIPYEKQVLSIESRKNPNLSRKVDDSKFDDIVVEVRDKQTNK